MQKRTYNRLRLEDRKVIDRMTQAKKGQREIAEALGVSQPTISRELNRNRKKKTYSAKTAQWSSPRISYKQCP